VARALKAGIVGCGTISGQYVAELALRPAVELVRCADLEPERARRLEAEHGIPAAPSTEALLADPEVELVLNLTVPAAHAEVSLAAVSHGKHVYSEKPVAVTLEDGRRVLEAAERAGVRVGCAPDTFLSGSLQACRRLVDEGAIGEPVAAVAFFAEHGHEAWHPAPDFYYEPGGGPLLDMGPYYLTALVSLLGPIARVAGSARASFPERVIGNGPRRGERIEVRVPTHVAGVVDFAGGAIGTLVTSFDVWGSTLPRIEVYGSEGSLSVPDPNVTVARECRILPVEFVVRAYLSGASPTSIWTAYARGERRYCGHALPDGLHKHQRLPRPLLTPTSKAEQGRHDELTSREEVIAGGGLSAGLYDRAERLVMELFAEGTRFAEKQGLILVDTKYELGLDARGELLVVDEIHTPDSSRYWYRESWESALAEGKDPKALDKEYVRAWLVERGWRGEGTPPALPVEVRCEAARRYVETYERVTGQRFVPDLEPPLARIRRNLGLSGG